MEEMMGHWLSISAGIFLLAMVLYGHYRGFLRMSVNLLALILSIGIVRMTAPYITTYIRENTQLHHTIEMLWQMLQDFPKVLMKYGSLPTKERPLSS